MGKAERGEALAQAMQAKGESAIAAACRCASPAAGTSTPLATPGLGGAVGAALYRRHKRGQAHGLPGFFLLGVGPEVVELWSEDRRLMPDELLWRWRRTDVQVSEVDAKLMFTHLVLAAPELEPTKVRAVTGGFKGYGSEAIDLLSGG